MKKNNSKDLHRNKLHAVIAANYPGDFVNQQISNLFIRDTDPSGGITHKIFANERDFWIEPEALMLESVCLKQFRITNWFPRTPGVYWSEEGQYARRTVYDHETTYHPILGPIFSPMSKLSLIEEGGVGNIRLSPRRIDNTDCWLATAVTGEQCSGGIPLVIPDYFIRTSKIEWGDTVTIYGKVRLLKDAGLNDTSAHVHHSCPIIIFVDKIDNLPKSLALKTNLIIAPTVLFGNAQDEDSLGSVWSGYKYTFLHCLATSRKDIGNAASWINEYARHYGGTALTNFDELLPFLSGAPLSYQRLLDGTFDRSAVRKLGIDGNSLARKIEININHYNNFGQAGAMGSNSRSNENLFSSNNSDTNIRNRISKSVSGALASMRLLRGKNHE